MGKIEGFWIRNFGVLKQIGVGSCFLQFAYVDDDRGFEPFPLGAATLFAGANGSGKSTIFDAFMFLSDTMRYGVEKACLKRGGFDAIYTRGAEGPLSIGINYRVEGESQSCTYAVSILRDKAGKPFVETEILAYREAQVPFPILYVQNGAKSIRYLLQDEHLSTADLNKIEFTDFRHLGLSRIDVHPAYPAVRQLRDLLENWCMSTFSVDIGRGLSKAATARFVNPRGGSLAELVKYMAERYPDSFQGILDGLLPRLPQTSSIRFQRGENEEPALLFGLPVTRQNNEPTVSATRMSDGFLRLLTYMLLMEEPLPAPLVGIEEPENGLDRVACWKFADELARYASEGSRLGMGSQVFVSTHHPGIADALKPQHVWVLELNAEGYAVAHRACDDLILQNLINQGRELSATWFSDFFESKL